MMNPEVTRFEYFSPLFVNQTLFTWGASVGEQSFYMRVGIQVPRHYSVVPVDLPDKGAVSKMKM